MRATLCPSSFPRPGKRVFRASASWTSVGAESGSDPSLGTARPFTCLGQPCLLSLASPGGGVTVCGVPGPWRTSEGSVSQSSWKLLGEAGCGQGPGHDGPRCPNPAPALGFRPPLSSALPRQVDGFRVPVAQRLVRMLQICAGHVPGVSALNLLSLLRSSENPTLEDL